MKNWTQRFAILAVLGAIISSSMLVGCGGPAEDDAAPNAANAAPKDDAE